MAAQERAAIYCRISHDALRDDAELRGAGVQRQELDCRALAERLGLEVVEVYTDNDISASTLSRKPRPAYERMLMEARAGRFDRILAYSNSRLTRRVAQLEQLINLYKETGIVIHTVVSGDDDLSTADGRMVAGIKAQVDQAEAERTSERLKAAHRHRAMNGKVWKSGYRPFGWMDDHKTLHPVEAPLLLEAVESSMRGGAIYAQVKRWNEQGITTAAGKKWSQNGLQKLLMNPRLCGWMTYHKEIVKDEQGKPVVGEWEPLITVEMFEALQAAIAKRAMKKRRFSPYLLSAHLRCGKCSGGMWGGENAKMGRYYRCQAGHLTIGADRLDRYMKTALFVHMGTCRGPVREEAERTWLGEGRLTEVSEKISELMAAYNAGRLSGDIILPQVEKLDLERQQLTKERDAFYREPLAEKAPSMVQALEANVDFLAGETEWLEEEDESIQDAYDFDGWSELFNQHSRTIFVRPYEGPHRSPLNRVDVFWDDNTTDGGVGVAQSWHRKGWKGKPGLKSRPKQVPAVMRMLEDNPSLSGKEIAEHYGVSRTYGYRLRREALEVMKEQQEEQAR